MSTLTAIVAPAYVHVEKTAVPTGVVGTMKWYDLQGAGRAIPGDVRSAAHAVVDGLVDAADVGFVIVHACGTDVTLLLVNRWRNDNELWETVFAQQGDGAFAVVDGDDPTRATFCVWELGIVNHERLAWADLLRGPRDQAALDAYLRSTFRGVV